MTPDIDALNQSIIKFRDTVLDNEVASLRAEVAVVVFNHSVKVINDFVSIDEFNPEPLVASGGTKMCAAIYRAVDMIERRKQVYNDNGIGHYRPWLFILTDGMTTDGNQIPSVARRVRDLEANKEVTTFAILNREAKNSRYTDMIRQITDRTLPMEESAYEELMDWLAESTVVMSNSIIGENVRLEDPNPWLEVGT